jgi:hypothetical protein
MPELRKRGKGEKGKRGKGEKGKREKGKKGNREKGKKGKREKGKKEGGPGSEAPTEEGARCFNRALVRRDAGFSIGRCDFGEGGSEGRGKGGGVCFKASVLTSRPTSSLPTSSSFPSHSSILWTSVCIRTTQPKKEQAFYNEKKHRCCLQNPYFVSI